MGTEVGLGVGISPSHLIPFQSASVSVRMLVEIEQHQEMRGEERKKRFRECSWKGDKEGEKEGEEKGFQYGYDDSPTGPL
jgi:hypothetical protein